jgi:hypothetical protein
VFIQAESTSLLHLLLVDEPPLHIHLVVVLLDTLLLVQRVQESAASPTVTMWDS